jgi:hypothetical protein
MSGSWEIKERQKVLLCTIHTEATSIHWAAGFKNLIIPGSFHFVSGMPFDHARNACVQTLLGSPYEYLFFLDSDVIAPPDAILRLLSHNQPIMSGMYCRRSPPHSVPVMMKNHQWVTKFPMGSVVEVELVGAGCLLVHRSVFERVPAQRPGKPWFDWRVDLKGHMPDPLCLSEDYTWNYHVRQHGYKILVDTSVRCRHVGMAEFDYGSVLPAQVPSCAA